jgi:hypothetical protein
VTGRCTCRPSESGCTCQQCRDLAVVTAACPDRLDKLHGGRVASSYDGMCDECFTRARDIRRCG